MTTLATPLYHGTSNLFLSQIVQSGLGGQDVIAQWRVLTLAHRIHPLVQNHLAQEDDLILQVQSFGWMCEQRNGHFNFQHGHAYLSPSEKTAVRYAIDKRYGSELLTYTLALLEELIRRSLIDREGALSREFHEVFYLLGRTFAPMLVEVDNVSIHTLLDEHGDNPQANLDVLAESLAKGSEIAELMLQQTNFRLAQAAPLADLTFWLLDFGLRRSGISKHVIYVPGARNAGMNEISLQ